MIVQGDPKTRSALQRIFARRGWQVREASTLGEGFASLSHAPDWMILDVELSDGNGQALLQRIRAEKLPTRVVICTEKKDSSCMAEIVALGPDLVLHKPIDLFALLSGIGVVDGH